MLKERNWLNKEGELESIRLLGKITEAHRFKMACVNISTKLMWLPKENFD